MTSRGRGRGRGKVQPPKKSPDFSIEDDFPALPGGVGANGAPPGLAPPPGLMFQKPPPPLTIIQTGMKEMNLRKADSGIGFNSEDKSSSSVSPNSSKGESEELENERPLIAAKPDIKGDRCEKGGRIPLQTNVWVFKLPRDTLLFRYNVTITVEENGGFRKDLTKGANDDHRREEKRRQCHEILWQLIEQNRDVFTKPFAALYDRRKMYYSREKLGFSGQRTFNVQWEGKPVTILMEFAGQINLGNFESECCQDLDMRTRDQQQILEVLTSQPIYFSNNTYVQLGKNVLDTAFDPQNPQHREKDIKGGKYLASGFSKGSRIIEGEGPEPVAALQLDQKKAQIFKPQNVVLTTKEIVWPSRDGRLSREQIKRELEPQLKGLVVKILPPFSQRGRKFQIYGVTELPSTQVEFDFKDEKKKITRTVSVANYFRDIKGHQLNHPMLPCLIQKTPQKTSYFPMEVCEVCSNQRVPIQKQTPDQMQIAIKKCALKPSERRAELAAQVHQAQVFSNKFLGELGIQLIQKPLVVQGRVLPKPIIQYMPNGRGASCNVQVNRDGNWDMKDQKWLIPGVCGPWAVVNLVNEKTANTTTLQNFLKQFTTFARTTGIQMKVDPYPIDWDPLGLESLFKNLALRGYEFALFIMESKRDNFQKDMIKNLEQKYDVITQCVRYQIVDEIGNPRPDPRTGRMKNPKGTLTNILAKTNLKLGGLNFNILIGNDDKLIQRWFNGDVLYLGVDVNHPPPQSADERRMGIPPKEPSVIGMVGSSAEKRCQFRFTGEHWYQDPRVEKITAMEDLCLEFLRRFARGARTVSKLPPSVFLFRDGVSEGQYKMLLTEEIPMMKKAFATFGEEMGQPGWNPKLTVIVVLKRHTMRLMHPKLNERDRATQQDIPVGSVVDHTVVHPTNWEFYLQSHRAIQGTAKCSKYCVVYNENEFLQPQNEVEGIAYILAHDHQIIDKSVSLPAPVYGADEMAERGKRLYRAEMGGSDASSSGYSTNEVTNWEEFSEKHKISGSRLENRKHWA